MFLYQYRQYGNNNKMGAREPAVNKGVGGYRPTVNWRDISIRRRNVAAKQVLACVILSGIVIIVLGIVITILGILVIKSKCPFEWAQTSSGTCYYFAEHNATWREGRAYCKNQGATMLDLHSDHEKEFITERMVGRSWLGLRRKKDEMDFKWISGAKMNYTQWEGVNVSSPANVAECALMENTGLWLSEPCENNYSEFEDDEGPEAHVICEYLPVYNPFVLIGPVVIFCGLIVLVLSIEICIRRKEFKEKNPEVMMDDDDDERQVDAGLINYGYGHFGEAPESTPTTSTPTPVPGTSTRVSNWPPPMKPLSPSKSMKESVSESSQKPSQSSLGSIGVTKVAPVEDTGSGPMVNIVPASLPNSPVLASAPVAESTQSQENMELLLSPKTLE